MMWYGLDLIVTSETHEAVEYALMEVGAVGTETNEIPDELVQVTGYFDHTPNRELVRGQLADALRIYNQSSSSVSEMSIREVPAEDWLGEWKKNWQPVKTGRFMVAPPWSHIPEASEQVVIRIEPGMAFGTGTHETTRLCLMAIEKYFAGGSFLDVGTGTGILAIAAAKMFPGARLEACDIDAEAIEIAKDNARLNDVGDRIYFHVGSVDDKTESADLVCANLTAPVIVELLPMLLGATCGRLVLSGILDSQIEMVKSRLLELAIVDFEVDQDGEWAALVI